MQVINISFSATNQYSEEEMKKELREKLFDRFKHKINEDIAKYMIEIQTISDVLDGYKGILKYQKLEL